MSAQREWLERDYYKILGVSEKAEQSDIKRAYRKLAQKWHPDQNPNDPQAEKKFKEIGEAYGVVGDAQSRAEYDNIRRYGGTGFQGAGGDPFAHFNMGGSGGGGDPIQDLFRTVFASGGAGGVYETYGQKPQPRKGLDVRADVHLSFEDALAGVKAKLRVPTGGGSRELTVKVPAGIKDGAIVRVAGRGGSGIAGGPDGDLLVTVHVEPHPYFGRRGDDVTLTMPISFSEAALGTKLRVPLIDGETSTIKIPSGTPSGMTFRLRGKGAPKRGGSGSGDLMITVEVEVPSRLSRKQKDLVKQLGELDDTSDRDELFGMDGKVPAGGDV